ncbi:MAG: DUF2577 domain-containing protein [Bacteroidales bacterium]|nr:DUF2577 domain-containing protein [Bacteroidales bacterium]
MADALDLLKAVKKAATDAVDESKPVQFCFGTVLSTSPLKVDVEQKVTLGEKQLSVAKTLTNFSITVSDSVEGQRTMTFYNALAAGDKVIMIRQQGGQKYVIIDRVG